MAEVKKLIAWTMNAESIAGFETENRPRRRLRL
jgi:hypothetical protein